jgi:hypothetical protein
LINKLKIRKKDKQEEKRREKKIFNVKNEVETQLIEKSS